MLMHLRMNGPLNGGGVVRSAFKYIIQKAELSAIFSSTEREVWCLRHDSRIN